MSKYIVSYIIGAFALGSAFHNAISSDYEAGVAAAFSEAAGVVCAKEFEATTSSFKLCTEEAYDRFTLVHIKVNRDSNHGGLIDTHNNDSEYGGLTDTLMSYLDFKWDQFLAANASEEHEDYANRSLEKSKKEFNTHWAHF